MALDGRVDDGDDRESSFFSTARGGGRRNSGAVEVPELVLVVVDVHRVLAILLVQLALPEKIHGDAMTARSLSLSLGCWLRREKKGKRENGGGEGGTEELGLRGAPSWLYL